MYNHSFYNIQLGPFNFLKTIMSQIHERIKKVNSQLLDLGYSFKEIETFWNECIKEAKEVKNV